MLEKGTAAITRIVLRVVEAARRALRPKPQASVPAGQAQSLDTARLAYLSSAAKVPIYSFQLPFRHDFTLHGYPVFFSQAYLYYLSSLLYIKTFYAVLIIWALTRLISIPLQHRFYFVHGMSMSNTGTFVLFDVGKITGERIFCVANIDQIEVHDTPIWTKKSDHYELLSPLKITVKSMVSTIGHRRNFSFSLPVGGIVHAPDLLLAVSKQQEVDLETGATTDTRKQRFYDIK